MANLSRIEELFHRVVDAPAAAESILQAECAGNDSLLRAVQELWNIHSMEDAGIIDCPFAELERLAAFPELNADQQQNESHRLLEGDVLLNYEILKPLGEGGMGTVFLAQELQPIQRLVAIKLLKNGTDDTETLRRFAVERQVLAGLRHMSIPSILNAGTSATGTAFLVLDFIDGIALNTYCKQKDLDVAGRIQLFIELCQIVEHVHGRGIIHRDIKSANVLVSVRDGAAGVYLIDFGIARVVSSSKELVNGNTGPGQILGTPGCMSPEQYLPGPTAIDQRSDIYSLGLLLYKLLTDSSPPGSLDENAANRLLAVQDPKPPSSASTLTMEPRVARQLDAATLKCLRVSPEERYQHVSDLLVDLNAILSKLQSAGRRTQKPTSLNRQARRFVSWLACAVMFLILPHASVPVSAPVLPGTVANLDGQANVVRVDSETFERISEILNDSGIRTAASNDRVEIRERIEPGMPSDQQVVTLLPDFVPADAI